MQIEIPEFKEFPDSNISGRMIVNPFWLEHLLNLFFQGYLGEVWEENPNVIDEMLDLVFDILNKTSTTDSNES